MKCFLTLIFILAFTFPLRAQEHTRPPRTTPTPTPTGGTPSNTWARFTSEDGRFSVLMPGTPKESNDTVPSEHGPYTTHMFILRNETNVFVVGWGDYDPSFNFNLQTELEANRDNFVKGIKGTLVESRALKIDGYKAIEFTAETTTRVFRSRVYMVGRRPYQIIVGSPKGAEDSNSVSKFLDSFKVSAS